MSGADATACSQRSAGAPRRGPPSLSPPSGPSPLLSRSPPRTV
eukprot:CAMPEP_0206242998 /NCGR_PEP_ID=MMETSP0047_2-20121206/17365_1 /ASSEMBLY_ACC=CAM_ASM_000192 /TAXON_ID=195065 /ORGANISM="Chroomonas mesostigmatica_cf, Strain CCMP1168" /LENGTH=42 /DNA_ID= /DNA_START= /DNA_END= /DNA_ORIENTATION=